MFFSGNEIRTTKGLLIGGLTGLLAVSCSCSTETLPDTTGTGTSQATNSQGQDTNPFPLLDFHEVSGGLPTKGTWLGYPRLKDLNGDGLDDLVASNREEDGYHIYEAPALEDASGKPVKNPTWIKRNEGIPDDMMYGSADFADFNSDGITDLAVNSHSDALRIFINDGKMNWTEPEGRIQNLFLLLDIATGDLNGDGHADAAGIGHFKGGISLYEGDGKGGMTRMSESMSVMGAKAFGREILMEDMNGDGIDDVITTSNVGMKVFLTHAGESPYWEDISDGMPNPVIGNSLYACVVGDFIEGDDGKLEVGYAAIPSQEKPEDRNTIGIMSWNPEERLWTRVENTLPREHPYRELKTGDIDLDGHLDLLALDIHRGPIIFLGDGHGGFTAAGRIDCTGRSRADLGDINGDGMLDVVIAFSAKGDAPAGIRAFINRPEAWSGQ